MNNKVSGIIRKLQQEMGGAILIADILTRAGEDGIAEAVVYESIDKLEEDGIISKLDDEHR